MLHTSLDFGNRGWSTRASRALLLALGTTASFTFGACFTGYQSLGLPCSDDAQCGTQACTQGFCGGVVVCDDETEIDAELACDGTPDCPNGYDEDPEICPDATSFDCASGDERIPSALLCDGEADCTDGSDEGSICAGRGINQCETGDPNGDVSYASGPSAPGIGTPLKVLALDIMGSPSPDAVFAGRDSTVVSVAFDLEGSAKQFAFDSADMFEGRTVMAVEAGDVNGDEKDDVVIVAGSMALGGAIYVYKNNAPMQPTLFGPPITLPDLGGNGVAPTVRAIRLGRLNDDTSIDMVGVFDVGPVKGLIGVSFGDSSGASMGGDYFTIEGLPISSAIEYDEIFDAVLANIDGQGFDELLISGIANNVPTLWILSRNGADATSWADAITMMTPVPGLLAVGKIQGAPEVGANVIAMPDLAILDLLNARISVLRNQMGALTPAGEIQLTSTNPKSLVWADINCDGNGDFVYSVNTPPRVEVLFGDGMAGVLADTPLTMVDQGIPSGDLAVTHFDADATPDVFSMFDAGEGLEQPEVRVFTTLRTQ
jgi:hypothetical protein